MSLDTCQALEDKLNIKIFELQVIGDALSSPASFAAKKINEVIEEEITDDIDDLLEDSIATVLSEINAVQSDIEDYTGSCLDAVKSSVFGTISAMKSESSDLLKEVPESINNMADYLNNFIGGFDDNNVPELINQIDEMLSCLSNKTTCLDVDKLQSLTDIVDDFTTNYSIDDESGEFSLDNFLASGKIDASDNVKNVVKSTKSTSDTIENQISSAFSSVSSACPVDYF